MLLIDLTWGTKIKFEHYSAYPTKFEIKKVIKQLNTKN